jgi:hypothetical protein
MSPLRHEDSDEECEIVYYKVDDLLTATPYLIDILCYTSVMWEVLTRATARSVSRSGAEICDVVDAEVVGMKTGSQESLSGKKLSHVSSD